MSNQLNAPFKSFKNPELKVVESVYIFSFIYFSLILSLYYACYSESG